MTYLAIRLRNGIRANAHSLSAEFLDALRELLNIVEPDGDPVKVAYTNYRGETSERTIRPMYPWYGSTEWHPEPQWLLRAFDFDKGAERDFALKDFGNAVPQPTEDAPVITDQHIQAFRKAFHAGRALDHDGDIRRGLEAVLPMLGRQ